MLWGSIGLSFPYIWRMYEMLEGLQFRAMIDSVIYIVIQFVDYQNV